MQMTSEESQDYNKLTSKQKESFGYYSRMHPNWSFKQVMAKVVLEEQGDIVIENGGTDVDPKDPSIWLTILEGVKATLAKFKSIGRSIFIAIDGRVA